MQRLRLFALGLCLLLVACDRKGKDQLSRADELLAKEPKAALKQYQAAERLGADQVAVMKGQAAAHENLRDFTKAQELLGDILASDPQDLDALVGLGRIALAQGKVEEGRKHLVRAVQLRPVHVPSLLLLAALAKTEVEAKVAEDALGALSGKSYQRFRRSAEFLVCQLSIKAVSGGDAGSLIDGLQSKKDAPVFNSTLALSFASALQVGEKDLLAEWLLGRVSAQPSAPDEAHEALAELALKLRHPTIAEQAVARLSQGFKRNPGTLLLEAQALELRRELRGEVKATAKALEATPRSETEKKLGLSLIHARSLIKAGQVGEAEQVLQRVLKSNPDYAPARLVLSAARIKSKKYALARSLAEPLIEDKTFGVQAAGLTARAYLAESQPEKAIEVAERCRKSHPDSASAFLLLVESQLAGGKKPQALRTLSEALDSKHDEAFVRARLVRLTEDLSGSDAAIALARKMLTERRDSVVELALAELYGSAKKYSEAEALLLSLAQKDPQNYAKLAALQRKQGKTEEAARSLETLLDEVPYDTATWLRLGLVYAEMGKPDRAAIAYRRLLELEPNAPVALNNLALILSEEPESRAEAVRLARRAKAAAPKNPAIIDTLGWCLVQEGSPAALKEARDLLLVASRSLGTAESKYHYGTALLALGELEAAVAQLGAAKEQGAKAKESPAWLPEATRRLSEAQEKAKKSAVEPAAQ